MHDSEFRRAILSVAPMALSGRLPHSRDQAPVPSAPRSRRLKVTQIAQAASAVLNNPRVPRPDGARSTDGLASGTLSELLRLMGAEVGDAALTDTHPVAIRRVRCGATLFHEGIEAESIYFVSIGSFKSIRTAEDGYEQVLGFARRGELLGFDAVCMGNHPTAAIALEDSRVFAMRIQDVFTLSQRMPALDRVLHMAVSRQLTARAEIADVMAAVAADVRLARFLVQLSARMQAAGQSPRRLYLRMSRSDIASYLGVAHATVSRSFSALAAWGCLRVSNRDVEILDLPRLRAFSRSTRGLIEEPLRASPIASSPGTGNGERHGTLARVID
jgi:CRP/FNR family transcriptional regulator